MMARPAVERGIRAGEEKRLSINEMTKDRDAWNLLFTQKAR